VKPAELVVRRTRVAVWTNVLAAAMFIIAAVWLLVSSWELGESRLAAGFILFLALAHAVPAAQRVLHDRPVLAIRPDGLHLPGTAEAPIAWERIRALAPGRGFAAWRGGRVDLALEPEAFVKLRLGQRMLGDPVTKLRGAPAVIAIHANGLDHDAAAIVAALQRYWPPAGAGEG
jgi:hypothetical protein